MNKQELQAKIESIIDENDSYIQDVKNGWDVDEAEAQNKVLVEVLEWVKGLE